VSTRFAHSRPPVGARPRADAAEQVALVARAKRDLLLAVHRHRLRREDLEDCFSQATLELLASVHAGRRFSGRAHLAAALEQRFLSRVHDRRRALSGRSPLQAALEDALPLDASAAAAQLPDRGADAHALLVRRLELRRLLELAALLTPDQRLVLACQVALEMERAEFCARFGWSFEKYRKVAQRARARLRTQFAAGSASPPPGAAEPTPGARLDARAGVGGAAGPAGAGRLAGVKGPAGGGSCPTAAAPSE
jgi:DNA-directed RNA polymerase specialized sigma24 family protein